MLAGFVKKVNGWLEGPCPFCGDRKRHFQISPDLKFCHCFRCGVRMSYRDFLQKMNIHDPSGVNIDVIPLKQRTFKSSFSSKISFLTVPEAIAYVKKRDVFPLAVAQGWKFDVIARKLAIPILDLKGNVCAYVMRSIDGSGGRYFTEILSNTFYTTPYNLHSAIGKKKLIICEGIFDAARLSLLLPSYGAIALLGKLCGLNKLQVLKRFMFDEVVVMLDSPQKDKSIWTSMFDVAKKVSSMGFKTTIAVLPEGDPGDADPRHILLSLSNRRDVS